MSRDGGEVHVSFCPVPTPDVQADVLSVGNATQTDKIRKLEKWKQPKEKNKGKGLNLGLDPSSTLGILISRRNWRDSLSELTSGKWSYRRRNRYVSWSSCMTTKAFSHYAMRI